nr:MAG TPA: hypothetical protein [Caudoviricetes sp.]
MVDHGELFGRGFSQELLNRGNVLHTVLRFPLPPDYATSTPPASTI